MQTLRWDHMLWKALAILICLRTTCHRTCACQTSWCPLKSLLFPPSTGVDGELVLQITLMSRDEASMLLVSYADLKACLQSAYNELKSRSSGTRMVPRLDMKRRT